MRGLDVYSGPLSVSVIGSILGASVEAETTAMPYCLPPRRSSSGLSAINYPSITRNRRKSRFIKGFALWRDWLGAFHQLPIN